jgi:hypothetical protein
MSHPDRCLLALFCFLFVAIIYASFGCNDCNPYKMEQGNVPDTIQADTLQACIDSATSKLEFKIQLNTASYENEPEMINP